MSAEEPTVFVVDDDPSVRRGLARLLRSADYRVETFASAREFLEHADVDSVGCLVLDVRMPVVNGFELQRELLDTGSRLPIVFITGHGDIPMAVQAIKAGAVDFLSKPFDDDALLTAVAQAIARSREGRLPTDGAANALDPSADDRQK